jgi:hypothetical protein
MSETDSNITLAILVLEKYTRPSTLHNLAEKLIEVELKNRITSAESLAERNNQGRDS